MELSRQYLARNETPPDQRARMLPWIISLKKPPTSETSWNSRSIAGGIKKSHHYVRDPSATQHYWKAHANFLPSRHVRAWSFLETHLGGFTKTVAVEVMRQGRLIWLIQFRLIASAAIPKLETR